jgi:hypothetical protein
MQKNVLAFIVWGVLIFQVQLFSFATPNNLDSLPDGPYVFKELSLPVKIQKLSLDYPPDNALPAVVAEYLAQRIPFEIERPIMPGQEVSNRPILQSLVYLPTRLAFSESTPLKDRIPRFDYVGVSWPNTLSLVSDFNFRLFLDVSIPINSFLGPLLFSLMFTSFKLFKRKDYLNLAVFTLTFIILNPFLLFHALFTWPKNLAASLIIIALYLLSLKSRPGYIMGSLIMGVSYLAHPLALPFMLFTSLYMVFQFSKSSINRIDSIRQYSSYLFCVFLPIIPWFIWSNYVLKIPSDLISQNSNLDIGITEHIWVRALNFYTLLFPTQFSEIGFSARSFLWSSFTNIWSPLGILVFFIPIVLIQYLNSSIKPFSFMLNNVLGGAILSGAFFSIPAIFHIHGWQTFWPIFAAVIFFYINQLRFFKIILFIQLFYNLFFITGWVFATTEINF